MSTAPTATPSVALQDVSTAGRGDSSGMIERPGIGFGRLIRIELRKMFDTRSGFWLMMSIGILSLIATVAVLIFASDESLTFESFATAIGVPMSILLPVVAVLGVTSEWSQRSGLTTFTMVPRRGRIIAAKLAATVLVGVTSMLLAVGLGAAGNLLGATIRGVDLTWGLSIAAVGKIILANVLGMLMGFVIATIIRNSAGALVGYFAVAFVLPTITGILYGTQAWFRDISRWVDFQANQVQLYDGAMEANDWGYLAFTGFFWLVIPLFIGVRLAVRSEVK
ncbi:ABC transporter permease [Demetria terragena]|uniref:ABC transporter permease n=1 Tax=Demetria terragena TaxID=63959 RepID=UPI00037F222F|nr:ABC transporter permease [Demetria terragena]